MEQTGMVSESVGSVVVYGPQACGKTRHAAELAAHFGMAKVVDDWMPGDRLESGALHLSQVEVPGAVAYEKLKVELGLLDRVPEDVAQSIRFALSRNESGDIEVYSCQSGVTLVLPVRDVDLLIDGIRGFLNDETERETISLCPISGKCESDRT